MAIGFFSTLPAHAWQDETEDVVSPNQQPRNLEAARADHAQAMRNLEAARAYRMATTERLQAARASLAQTHAAIAALVPQTQTATDK